MSETAVEADPVAGFAALMNKAAEIGDAEREAAPYGYTTDRATGEERPKKSPGRPRKPPTVDEIKAERQEAPAAPEAAPEADRPPARLKRRERPKADPGPVPQYREGQIAKGINKLYRKLGQIVRVGDPEVGEAIISVTRKDAEDDVTVGEAWEELARTNVRIRRFLLKLIAGGAWGQLAMAHAPILMALLLKPAVMARIPFARVVESLAEPDEDSAPGEGGLPGGMTAGDAQQMADLAQQQLAKMGLDVSPEMSAQMAAMAGSMMGSSRNQPRRTTRAQRHGG